MAKFKLAFVGCGGFAKVTAIAARLNPRIKIASCFDINMESANAFAKSYRVSKVCDSYEDVLASDIDAVYLPVPHFLHYDYIKKALDAGKHVFTEKPLCLTLQEAEELVELSKEKGLMLSVNFIYRYSKKIQKLIEKAQNKELGEHLFTNITVPWYRDSKYMNVNSWHGKKKLSGGGTLITQGIHALDIALACIDTKVTAVYGTQSKFKFKDVETEDTFALTIDFDDNSNLHFNSTMAFKKNESATIRYYGTKGKMIVTQPEIGFIVAVCKSLNDFVKSVIQGYKPLNYCENFLKITRIVEKAYISAETGEVIQM